MWLSASDKSGKHVIVHTKKDSKVRWKKRVDLIPRKIDTSKLPAYFKHEGKKHDLVECTEEVLKEMALDYALTIQDSKEGGNARIEGANTN